MIFWSSAHSVDAPGTACHHGSAGSITNCLKLPWSGIIEAVSVKPSGVASEVEHNKLELVNSCNFFGPFLSPQVPDTMQEQILAAATDAWTSFDAWAGGVERWIALAAHPGFPYDSRPTQGWPLTRLSAALALTAGYGILVLYGIAVRKPMVKGAKEDAGSVLAGIQREPIKALQIIYNAVQASGTLRVSSLSCSAHNFVVDTCASLILNSCRLYFALG